MFLKVEKGLDAAFDTHHNSSAGKVLLLSDGRAVCEGPSEERDDVFTNTTQKIRKRILAEKIRKTVSWNALIGEPGSRWVRSKHVLHERAPPGEMFTVFRNFSRLHMPFWVASWKIKSFHCKLASLVRLPFIFVSSTSRRSFETAAHLQTIRFNLRFFIHHDTLCRSLHL